MSGRAYDTPGAARRQSVALSEMSVLTRMTAKAVINAPVLVGNNDVAVVENRTAYGGNVRKFSLVSRGSTQAEVDNEAKKTT